MVQEIDVARVKQYNLEYNKCKEKAMQLNAEREMNKKEIDSLCAELSSELGMQVTLENIESIYSDKVDKINADLLLGESIIKRIEAEENQLSNGSAVQGVGQPVQNQSQVGTVQQNQGQGIVQPSQVQGQGQVVQPSQGQVVQPGQGQVVQPVVSPQVNLVPPQTYNPGYGVPQQGMQQPVQNQGYGVQNQGYIVPPQVQPVQNGFSSLGGLPNAEIKIDPPQGTASNFIQYASNNQNPVIPQMFSRGNSEVPSISTDELDDVEVI